MEKFKKKTEIVEVVEWEGINLTEVYIFLHGSKALAELIEAETWEGYRYNVDHYGLEIETAQGKQEIGYGDMILKDKRGNYTVCKANELKENYDKIKGIKLIIEPVDVMDKADN